MKRKATKSQHDTFQGPTWKRLGKPYRFFLGLENRNNLKGIITCVPKAGKLRNSLKNWRPLTLLISDQTGLIGFIAGWFNGKNTCLIYDA